LQEAAANDVIGAMEPTAFTEVPTAVHHQA